MKGEVIKALRECHDYISGQELCERFSVSRTAIWKVINQLKEEGYEIEAVRNRGYRMVEDKLNDSMDRETIISHMGTETMGREVVFFSEIDSTNIQAKVQGEKGAVHGTLVVSDSQTLGRGRRGRVWESPEGAGIFMSLLLRPAFAPPKAPMLTLVMALAVTKVIREYLRIDVNIKWPNDIVYNGKKLCGILTEMSTEIDYINYVVIGVGVNANIEEFPEEISEIATSLKLALSHTDSHVTHVNRSKLIACIMSEFEIQYKHFLGSQNLSFLMDEYNQLLINRNREVRVLEIGNEYNARALGIDENGELLVEVEHEVDHDDRRETKNDIKKEIKKEIVKVYAGEVSVRGVYGYV